MDPLIAAHALPLQATLVSNNTRHFGRIRPRCGELDDLTLQTAGEPPMEEPPFSRFDLSGAQLETAPFHPQGRRRRSPRP